MAPKSPLPTGSFTNVRLSPKKNFLETNALAYFRKRMTTKERNLNGTDFNLLTRTICCSLMRLDEESSPELSLQRLHVISSTGILTTDISSILFIISGCGMCMTVRAATVVMTMVIYFQAVK
jgi:hypothetical protein